MAFVLCLEPHQVGFTARCPARPRLPRHLPRRLPRRPLLLLLRMILTWLRSVGIGSMSTSRPIMSCSERHWKIRSLPCSSCVERWSLREVSRAVIENGDYITDFPFYPKPWGNL